MKFKKLLLTVLVMQGLISCGENKTEKTITPAAKSDTTVMTVPPVKEKEFAGVVFENKKDYICGMPISAGVSDTAHYKGKVYGFCATECKDEFLKTPQQYLTLKN